VIGAEVVAAPALVCSITGEVRDPSWIVLGLGLAATSVSASELVVVVGRDTLSVAGVADCATLPM